MRKSKKHILGVFAAMNQGEILESHGNVAENSAKKNRNRNMEELPFCFDNGGVIENNSENEEVAESKRTTEEEGWEMDNVIEIRSVSQLMEIRKQVNLGDPFYSHGNYRLMDDLDFHEKKWFPMGGSAEAPFCGTFDGNGHTIKNLRIIGRKKDCVGFFGYLKGAKVRNFSIEGNVKGGICTGALVGVSVESTISSCFVSAKVNGSSCTGGFVGSNLGKITHCFFSGIVSNKTGLPIFSAHNEISYSEK